MIATMTPNGQLQIVPENGVDEFALVHLLKTGINEQTQSWKVGAISVVMTDSMAAALGVPPAPEAPSFKPKADYIEEKKP